MLDNSLTLLEVHLVLDKLFQQTLHVSYFNEIILGSFGHGLVNKSRHYVLANSLTLLGVHLVLFQWFKQTLCVRYFTKMISGSFGNEQVNISRHYF